MIGQKQTMLDRFSDDLGNHIFQYASDCSAAFRSGVLVMYDAGCFVEYMGRTLTGENLF